MGIFYAAGFKGQNDSAEKSGLECNSVLTFLGLHLDPDESKLEKVHSEFFYQ
jgi:hypothetical protein